MREPTASPLRVVYIDSGTPPLVATKAHCANFTPTDTVEDTLGHCTAVAEPLLPNCLVQLYFAKIFDRHLSCPLERIVLAAEWAVEQQPDIVNLAIGMHRPDPALAAVIKQLVESSTIVVASAPAQGTPVYPAHFPGVLSATGDARCAPHQWSWLSSAQADIGAYVGQPAVGPAGASIGCGYATYHVAAQLTSAEASSIPKQDRLNWLKSILKERATFSGREYRGHYGTP